MRATLLAGLFTLFAILSGQTPPRPADLSNISYGPHQRNVVDLWKAKADRPTPLVVYIHGGGFRAGDKNSVSPLLLDLCLNAGISVAAINYRLSDHAAYPAFMHDGARAIQFLRSKAGEWNLDPRRIAATGGSAGAGISLWVGFHDDLAEPSSSDPVRRQSTRLTAMGVFGAQSSYDPRFIAKHIGEAAARHPALGPFYGLALSEYDTDRARQLFADASPITHLSAGDPPVWMVYDEPDGPLPPDAKPGQGIHHPNFGRLLKEQMDRLGIHCETHHRDEYPGNAQAQAQRQMVAFFQKQFAAARPAPQGPPPTRTDNVVDTLHGVKLTDPYRWLEDQQSPETRAWIAAQNAYTQSVLGPLAARQKIRRRLEELMKVETHNPPVVRAGRYFFAKRLAGHAQQVLYVSQGVNGKDEVLIDPHPMSPDQTTSVSLVDVADDAKLLAYGIRQGGEDERVIEFLEVDSRRRLADRLARGLYYSLAIKPDKSGFYYTRRTPDGPRAFYRAFGGAADTEVFGKSLGPQHLLTASLSPEGRYLVLHVAHGAGGKRTDVYVQNLEKPAPITAVVNDLEALFQGRVAGDRMFLHTNWKAPNGRIVEVDLANPSRDRWREVAPESAAVVAGFSLAGGKLAVTLEQNAVTSRIRILEPTGKPVRDISFPALGSASNLAGRWSSDEAFYTFESFGQPETIYRYEISSGGQRVWAQLAVPVESGQIEVKQVWYRSKDQTRVPMFVVSKKGLQLDGARPTLLTGYGGFNVSSTPSFSAQAALWVENGGVFALPNLRGGSEFGEAWHRAGMFENKQNVFDDFIAAAEWLIENGYTRPSRLAIRGGSNGGLLVGAAMTQRPELFGAVVCTYPLLDMVRYHRFLVARTWVSEYGSADDPKQFEYIRRYSPYHNVKDGARYPAVLFTTGDGDTRVAPLHARKMAARVQAASAPGKPVLLSYDTKAGHSRAMPVGKQIDDLTDILSFLFWQLGVD